MPVAEYASALAEDWNKTNCNPDFGAKGLVTVNHTVNNTGEQPDDPHRKDISD